jgi:hypothetical protein
MPQELFDLVEAEATAITEYLVQELRSANTPHYQDAGGDLLKGRCQRLVQAFLESTHGNPGPFVRYIKEVAEERISDGYDLAEVQQALSFLEERIWQLALQGSSIGNLVRNLSIVTGTVGRAKDDLARVFLARKECAPAAIPGVEGLFRGTEAHIEPEEVSR